MLSQLAKNLVFREPTRCSAEILRASVLCQGNLAIGT